MEEYLKACESEFWKNVFKAELDYILSRLRGARDVLSVGCGPAIIEGGLAEHGVNVVGLDVSKQALDRAPDSVRTVAGPAEKMGFESLSFDAVIYVASVQFIEGYEEAIEQSARVLRPGGKLLMLLLNPQSEFFKEKARDPDSYINRIRHTDLEKIERTAAEYFAVNTEYFLGIGETDVFQSRDPNAASLYVIEGIKRDDCCRNNQD